MLTSLPPVVVGAPVKSKLPELLDADLTDPQRDILALVAAGHGNKEIRYRLGIAERTVRAHLTELFHSLGVDSRMQAVVRARELGMIA